MERLGLAPEANAAIERLLTLLEADPSAPTTVRARAEAIDTHVADSLSGLELEQVRNARRIADLGAGAGFPGLILAAVLPETSVTLVESAGRKCAWVERAIETMGLKNAAVVNARAEEWPAGLGAHDLVTARALASLSVLVEYAAPLLGEGGSLVAWKGRRDAAEEADGAAAAAELGMEPAAVIRVQPFAAARDRHLHLYLKVGSVPDRFPRRAGMARKRPIQASPRG
ncbi:MAG: rRNA (guanine527-N7)-methyltransferase [Solirubrobacteraceae bacterium]|nr:rRNA (guanine527-N7)-methyltransferase [Solirubrobacteraceae bacterium]